MDWLTNPDGWIALFTLTTLEIVLGIDNVVFIAILAGKLPASAQARARRVGLSLALVTRVLLLLSLAWVIRLTAPLVTVLGQAISGRDLILIAGGLFLLAKSTYEIHARLEGGADHPTGRAAASFSSVIAQIVLLDVVFSLDSVITAVGMVQAVGVMIAAVVIAVGIMLVAAGPISAFVAAHPTVKMLALSFLLLIGVSLLLEGFDQHIPKGYIYFAMGFSVFVEMLNQRLQRRGRKQAPRPPEPRAAGAEAGGPGRRRGTASGAHPVIAVNERHTAVSPSSAGHHRGSGRGAAAHSRPGGDGRDRSSPHGTRGLAGTQ